MAPPQAGNHGRGTMFGSQPVSKRPSAPAYGFGTASRAQANKVFMSKDHAKTSGGAHSPGPSVYTLRGSVGSQPDGRKASAPHWAFGTSERFTYEKKSQAAPGPGAYQEKGAFGTQATSRQTSQPIYGFGSATREHTAKCFVSEDHNKSRHGVDSPGPMVYKVAGAFGKLPESKKTSQPAWVFGSTNRFQYDHVRRAATSPGPGAYSLSSSTGNQVSSTKTSAAAFGFGTSNREQANKLYLSPEHEKMSQGVHSPGPMAYSLTDAVGKQHKSNHPSSASWGFGTAGRFSEQEAAAKPGYSGATPGPGAYVV